MHTILKFSMLTKKHDFFLEKIKLCSNWFDKICLTINESEYEYRKFGITKPVELEFFECKTNVLIAVKIKVS